MVRQSLSTSLTLRKLCFLALLCTALSPISAQTFTKLVDFTGPNGAGPIGVIQGKDGNLYGITSGGGRIGFGTIFKSGLDGSLVTIHDFCSSALCADGMFPQGLTAGRDGNIYGTTSVGGDLNNGIVFKITPQGTLTVLHTFDNTDGAGPRPVVLAKDGNFYGVTEIGGTNNGGTVFKLSSTGRFQTLHNFQFCAQLSCMNQGGNPSAPLVQGQDGNFYGTSFFGGTHRGGLIYKVTPMGGYSVLYNFCSQARCADGRFPSIGQLVAASDGNLYGVTTQGGTGRCSGGCGVFFSITLNGVYTVVHDYAVSDNSAPGAVFQATDGNFYGLATDFQTDNNTIIQLTPSGTLTTLFELSTDDGLNTDSLVQASDGNFYGTALLGGLIFDDGTFFKFSPGAQ